MQAGILNTPHWYTAGAADYFADKKVLTIVQVSGVTSCLRGCFEQELTVAGFSAKLATCAQFLQRR